MKILGILLKRNITDILIMSKFTPKCIAIWGHFGTELKRVQLPETPLKRPIGFRTFRDMRWNRLVLNFAKHPGASDKNYSTRLWL